LKLREQASDFAYFRLHSPDGSNELLENAIAMDSRVLRRHYSHEMLQSRTVGCVIGRGWV